ncbi:MAG: hypothetical protein ACXVK3_16795, partial [Candidatus Angelobacter sp.]
VECKALAVESVNAHLAPIRERRHALAQNPGKLRQTIQHGAQKAIAAAEETMSAVRDAIGLLRLGAVAGLAAKEEATAALRVPEAIASAKNDDEKWELRTAEWLERVNRTHALKKDRSRTFITRRGRKVGLYAAEEENGTWRFLLEDRPVNVLVLLAQDKDRYLQDYVLPPKVIQDHWKHFGRKEKNVIIEIHQAAGGDMLLSTTTGSVPIQQYEGDYSALQ